MKRNQSEYYPILFSHVYKNAVWGGNLISKFRGDISDSNKQPISESWELVDRLDSQSIVKNGSHEGISIRELIEKDPTGIVGVGHQANDSFPLLFKIIDAKKDLSLQIHPDENTSLLLDNAQAKSEMWYVLEHDENAQILNGLKEGVSIKKFVASLGNIGVKKLLNSFKSENGDAFMIHGNTMHSIGGGNLIYEIQQNSNTTYRVSDWERKGLDGKPRELHLAEAITCLSKKQKELNRKSIPTIQQVYQGKRFNLVHKNLATCSYFHVDEFSLEGELNVSKSKDACQVLYAIDGDLSLKTAQTEVAVKKGSTCLVPASLSEFIIEGDGSKFLRAKVA